MPRINLLPWREQQRTDRKKAFGVGLGAAFFGAVLVTGLGWLLMNQLIDAQQNRNSLLRGEIRTLDKQIEEINSLEQQKAQAIARMQIIEKLQLSRSEIVHVMDTFVQTVPDLTYLTAITQTEDKFKIQGITQSPARVSDLFRSLSSSEWLKDVDLGPIVDATGPSAPPNSSEFTLTATQKSVTTEADPASVAADKRKTTP